MESMLCQSLIGRSAELSTLESAVDSAAGGRGGSLSLAGDVPDAPAIADYRAVLGTLVPEWSRPDGGDAEVSPVIIGEALLRLLARPGRPAGLLILEDLHWADPETLAIVEYLCDNLATANAM